MKCAKVTVLGVYAPRSALSYLLFWRDHAAVSNPDPGRGR